MCRSDVIEIETWIASEGRIGTRRDWVIKDYASGEVIGRSTRCARIFLCRFNCMLLNCWYSFELIFRVAFCMLLFSWSFTMLLFSKLCIKKFFWESSFSSNTFSWICSTNLSEGHLCIIKTVTLWSLSILSAMLSDY